MKCNYCGNSVPDDSEFCQYCGKRIVAEIENENRSEKQILDLGLSKDSPVLAAGIEAEKEYISKLCRLDGEKIIWNREGSIFVNDSIGIVDIYKGEDLSGKEYGPVYITMYATETTRIPVNGFSLSSPVIGEYDPTSTLLVKRLQRLNEKSFQKNKVQPSKKVGSLRENHQKFCENCGAELKGNKRCEKCDSIQVRSLWRFFALLVTGLLVVFVVSSVILFDLCAKKNQEILTSFQKIEDLNAQLEENSKTIGRQKIKIENLEKTNNNLKIKSDFYTKLCSGLSSGNLGYASNNFHVSDSIVILKKSEGKKIITLTAYWPNGGTVAFDYDSFLSKTANISFDKKSWDTSTSLTISPIKEGVTIVTFSNNVDNMTFKMAIVVI